MFYRPGDIFRSEWLFREAVYPKCGALCSPWFVRCRCPNNSRQVLFRSPSRRIPPSSCSPDIFGMLPSGMNKSKGLLHFCSPRCVSSYIECLLKVDACSALARRMLSINCKSFSGMRPSKLRHKNPSVISERSWPRFLEGFSICAR